MSYASHARAASMRITGIVNTSLPTLSSSTTGSAVYSIGNTGVLTYSSGGSSPTVNWVTPANAAVAARYQVKVSVISGAFASGPAADTWHDCSTTRTWSVGSGVGVTFTITIREKDTGIERSSATVGMAAL
jgi:hypothetical protein